MKFVSWNVNGLRARLKKDFMPAFTKLNADIFAVQEIKMQAGEAILDLGDYKQFWNYGERKGYSGTAIFSRVEPKNFTCGIDVDEFDSEGRVITLDLDEMFFVNVYVPNSHNLEWLERRMNWEDTFREYLQTLDRQKPVIICGDFNVAHQPIDLKNPQSNHHSAGFSDEERAKFSELLNAGFVDIFRQRNPTLTGAYTWWSYLRKARLNNAGWRIDYFLISERLIERVTSATIESDIFGSDHCPVTLTLEYNFWRICNCNFSIGLAAQT
ncbi:MAG: exodeoxyribonuclease III, partial [Selenomonadaceae bacterium]|nr:exodeoxyribonuclease III [Selenomonadaceae bacterium]